MSAILQTLNKWKGDKSNEMIERVTLQPYKCKGSAKTKTYMTYTGKGIKGVKG